MDRMSALDSGFFFAESENTPMHVGSVAVFEGPAPSYGDVVRLLLSKLSLVPRYRQRVREVPLELGRPVWVDDPHFQILYHVRHTAVPGPGSDEQLRNLAGRVLGQRLDMAKPLWELWLVEGLADGRWAIISKVHHCMVDGIAGTDLMQLMFDLEPDATHDAPKDWTPRHQPSSLTLLTEAVTEAVAHPLRGLSSLPEPGRRGPGREVAGRVRQDGRLDHAVRRQAGDHPDRPLAERADRPAPALGLDRGQVRGVQGRPDVVRRHGQRRRPRLDHRRLPRPAAGPRRAVVGAARRPLDGAGVGPDREPEGLPGQPGVRGLRRPAGRSRRPGGAADRDPGPDGRVQEDHVGGGRQLDHRDGQLRRADPARARRAGRDVRRPVLGARR